MKMKKKKHFNRIATILLTLLVLLLSPFVLPKLIGYEPYGILSDSMEPQIPVGSIVYVKEKEPENIEIGEIITFSTSVKNDAVATHRVIEKNQKQQCFFTKGDHNDGLDAAAVPYETVLGVVVCTIPTLGYVYQMLASGIGMFLCGFCFIIACLLFYLAKS